MSLEITRPVETIQDERERLVPLFQIYCTHEFGENSWGIFLSDPTFDKLMTQYYPKYGDDVFKELVDIVADVKDIPIKDILSDFGEFIRRYY